jgi:hypothetical protein
MNITPELPADALAVPAGNGSDAHATPVGNGGAGLSIPSGNGRGKLRLLTRAALDGRTVAAKLYDQLVDDIQNDLGGRRKLTTIELTLVEAYASAPVCSSATRSTSPCIRNACRRWCASLADWVCSVAAKMSR